MCTIITRMLYVFIQYIYLLFSSIMRLSIRKVECKSYQISIIVPCKNIPFPVTKQANYSIEKVFIKQISTITLYLHVFVYEVCFTYILNFDLKNIIHLLLKMYTKQSFIVFSFIISDVL